MNIPRVLAGLVLATAVYAAFFAQSASGTFQHAQAAVETCAHEAGRDACYERDIPELLGSISLLELFEVIRTVRSLDPEYQFCHVLAHKLGELVVAQDPSKWVEAIQYNPPDGLCSNGFIHGVVGGRFRAEVLDDMTLETHLPDFARACEPRPGWQPSALDQAICYHGMGHLYMFITDADIPTALSLCEATAQSGTGDFRRVCREGVYMQIYQPLEPDDFLLIERMEVKPTKETVREFCAVYERDEYEGACLRESWPFFRDEVFTGAGIERFCAGQPNAAEETACFESAFALLGRTSLGAPERVLAACAEVGEQWRSMCYAHSAVTIIEEDRDAGETLVDFCNSAPDGYGNECLEGMAQKAHFLFGDSPYRSAFCTALPMHLRSVCSSGPSS